MRWQGRSFHPNTSTAGSQLSWATSHLLHNSPASWQYLNVHSCKPKDLCCKKTGLGAMCLAFDSTRPATSYLELHKDITSQPHVSVHGEYKLALLAYYYDVTQSRAPYQEKSPPSVRSGKPRWFRIQTSVGCPSLSKMHLSGTFQRWPSTGLDVWWHLPAQRLICTLDRLWPLVVLTTHYHWLFESARWRKEKNEDAEILQYSRAILSCSKESLLRIACFF